MSQYTDEPVLVPSQGLGVKKLIGILVVIGVVLALLALPAFNAWLDHEAGHVERGELHGTTYTITLADGAEHTLEFGYRGRGMAVGVSPPLPPGATLRLRGSFGDETLTWNEVISAYGPTQADIDYFQHYRVRATIQLADRILWSGKRWAYGETDSHHGHSH